MTTALNNPLSDAEVLDRIEVLMGRCAGIVDGALPDDFPRCEDTIIAIAHYLDPEGRSLFKEQAPRICLSLIDLPEAADTSKQEGDIRVGN